MHRFVVGNFATGPAPPGVAPRCGVVTLALPGGRVWAVGHQAGEWEVTPGAGDARLLTAGYCLATAAEREKAAAAASRGELGPALALPGSHLTVLSTGSLAGETWVFGDGAGVVPLYWCEHQGAVWWATSATALAALTGADPDPAWLLAELTLSGVDHRLASSPFTAVRRVAPGRALVLSNQAAPRVLPLPHTAAAVSLPEGARLLRETFTTAVTRHARASSPVSCDLSGGVDSSSVACLAAAEGPVLAVTYTDARMREDDDLLYARRVAAEVGGITHRVIDGRDAAVTHFAGLEEPGELPVTDQPSLSLGVLSMLGARLAPVAAHGSAAHLTGRGGDNVLGTASAHRADAFLAGHRMRGLRGAQEFARACRIAPWRAWRQLTATLVTSYPRALERLAHRIADPLPATWRPPEVDLLAWCSPTAAARWLTPAGRAAVAELVASRVPHAAGHTAPRPRCTTGWSWSGWAPSTPRWTPSPGSGGAWPCTRRSWTPRSPPPAWPSPPSSGYGPVSTSRWPAPR